MTTKKVTTKSTTKKVELKESKLVLTNVHKGRVFICGKYLNPKESVTVTDEMQKNEQQKKLINNAIKMGLVKKS